MVTDGVRRYAVEVWNWDTGKRLYSIPLESAPLFVRFSRSGTFLLFGDMQWDSLHICRSADGHRCRFRPEGFGMVGFAETSRTNAILMTYQAAGTISYWDIATGASIKEIPTVADLVNIRTSDDRGCLVGQSDSQLIGIDAVTGETRFSMSTVGIASMDISGDVRGNRLPFRGRLPAGAQPGQRPGRVSDCRPVRLAAPPGAHDAERDPRWRR